MRLTTHLLPLFRGIQCSTYIPLENVTMASDVENALVESCNENYFLRYKKDPNEIELKNVQNTNFTDIGFFIDGNILILFSALDNLQKGAAGQAIQNMNLLLGFDEETSLN